MLFGGMKHLIDSGKVDRLPVWVKQLQWTDQSTLPQPLKEITQDEWLRLGICGHEVEQESFYQGFQIPGDNYRPFGGWACHIRVYHTYALVDSHVYYSISSVKYTGEKPEIGMGSEVDRDQYGRYTIRYFKLGCNHLWRAMPEESRMCLHVSKCSLCGMRQEIDSSD